MFTLFTLKMGWVGYMGSGWVQTFNPQPTYGLIKPTRTHPNCGLGSGWVMGWMGYGAAYIDLNALFSIPYGRMCLVYR